MSSSLQRLLVGLVRYARTRADLVEVELDIERRRLGTTFTRTALFSLCALVTVQLLVATLLALAWSTAWRLHVAGGLLLLCGGATAWAWHLMKAEPTRPGRPLRALVGDPDAPPPELASPTPDEAPPPAVPLPPTGPVS